MRSVLDDLRYAARLLLRSPGFTLVAVATLALGIGANTTIFGVVDSLLLRPPARVAEPDRLVWLWTSDFSGPPYGASSYPDYEEFAKQTDVLSGVAAFTPKPANLVRGGETRRLMTELVSGNYFDVLGVRPVLGRFFAADEGKPGEPVPVTVLSYALWQGAFGGDPGVVGRTVQLGASEFTVVGVAPEGYRGGLPILQVDAWVPVTAEALLSGGNDYVGQRGNRGLMIVGRLRDGVGLAAARSRFDVVASRLHAAYPAAWTDVKEQGRRITVMPEKEARIPPMVRGPALGFLALLGGVVILVLLICCANVAGLLVARAAARSREIAVRLSLGASRRRLVRQLLTESALLALLGGSAGIAIAYGTADLLARFQPPLPVSVHLDARPDSAVLAFALLITLGTSLVFGLLPALQATRPGTADALKDAAGAGESRGRARLRRALVVAQVAVSVVLLAGAALFVRSLQAAQDVDPGLDPSGVIVASMDLTTQGYDDARREQFYDQLKTRLAALPGVTGVALAKDVPLGLGGGRTGTGVAGYQPAPGEDMEFHYNIVGPDYFDVLHVPVVRGRGFTPADRAGSQNVVVVNETFARRFWPGEDPVGKRLTHFSGLEDLQVVGVARDGKYTSLGEDPTPYVYGAYLQEPRDMVVHVRTSGDPGDLIPLVRREVRTLDPRLPILTLQPMEEVMAVSLLPQRIGAAALGLFAGLALLLSTVGLYGVVAYSVSRRTREIGVRVALGAGARDVVGLVVRQGLGVTAVGLGLGLVVAAGLATLAGGFLFGVPPVDPLAYAAVILTLLAAAAVASILPARRAARVDPASAIRHE